MSGYYYEHKENRRRMLAEREDHSKRVHSRNRFVQQSGSEFPDSPDIYNDYCRICNKETGGNDLCNFHDGIRADAESERNTDEE